MSSARLLIPDVLRTKQATHGYDIRRKLESWRAEQWANVAYGSIYHALSSMTKEGLVEPVDSGEGSGKHPARIACAIAEHGEKEFQRLLRESTGGNPNPP
jgi:DNA-binding PadR family transcriptional regulator